MFIVYVEIPIAFFSVLATYFFLTLNSVKKAILTGTILALSFYTKQTGLFLIAGLVIYAIFLKDKKYFKLTLIAILISIILSSAYLIRNIIFYKYPYVYFLNYFFQRPETESAWEGVTAQMLSSPMFTIQSYTSNMGWLLVTLIIFSISWFLVSKKVPKDQLLFLILSFSFLTLYYIFYFSNLSVTEPRNLFIIFPQLSLLGGFFLWKLKNYYKYSFLLILLIVILSLQAGLTTAINTSSSQRYPDDYIEALKWINQNTNNNSIILTTYSGSVKYFANRDTIWGIKELPDLMLNSNSTYIYEIMKKYNVSYILVWRGVLSDRFIIPESNLIGVFTYNFLENIINDDTHFNITHQNQNNIIFEVL